MSVSQSTLNSAVAALETLLIPNTSGEVLFGVNQEPFRLSQIEALTAIKEGLREGKAIGYVVQPGGTGKTREGIALAEAMATKGKKTLFVSPTQQAVDDFADRARRMCPELSVGAIHGDEKILGDDLTFVTYASLNERLEGEQEISIQPGEYDLVIWDEAHRYLTLNAQEIINKFENSINIGFTATPRYYEGKDAEYVFFNLFYELDIDTAIERGECAEYRNLLIQTAIKTGLKSIRPEQEESAEVAQAINIEERNNIFPQFYLNTQVNVPEKGKIFSFWGCTRLVYL